MVRYRKQDVVDRALTVLDDFGLADLSMRRLGAELGIQPSALYHHFANKQTLLAAVADEILVRGAVADPAGGSPDPDTAVVARCVGLRAAMLAYRDGAEVVSTSYAFGLGGLSPYDDLRMLLDESGCPPELARAGAGTLLYFVFGHVTDEQTHLQAAGAGAINADWGRAPRPTADFELGLRVILDGVAVQRGHGSARAGVDPVWSPTTS